MGDMLMSVGVIIAATIIFIWPELWQFDPICTYLFSVIVMCSTIPVIGKCLHVIMEGVPKNFDLRQLE